MLEHERGNLQQALPYYQRVVSESKDDAVRAQAWANLGHLYSDLGDSANADHCYREAQRLAALVAASNDD